MRRSATSSGPRPPGWLPSPPAAGEPAGTRRIWDGATGRLVWTVPLTAPGVPAAVERQAAAWLPDGGSLLTGDGSGNLIVWGITTTRILQTFSCHLAPGGALSAVGW